MRKFFPVLLLFLILPVVAGDIFQEFHLEGGSLEVEQEINLECEGHQCPVNYWAFEWPVLSGAQNIEVNDSYGEIEDWTKDDQNIEIETNTGERRSEETVSLSYETRDPVKTVGNMNKAQITPPNLEGSKSKFRISAENLSSVAYGRNLEYPENDSYNFTSEVRPEIVITSAQGSATGSHIFVNDDPIDAEDGMNLVQNFTGVDPASYSIPVVTLGLEEYEEKYDDWSVGKLDGGVIYLKDDGSDLRPTLVHETVHALNRDQLDWKRFQSDIIDEGLATFIEGKYRDKMAERGEDIQISSGLFGDTRHFRGVNDTYRVGSRGDFDSLVESIESQDKFYKDWKTHQDENREFGYAYSELVIKEHYEDDDRKIKDFYEVGRDSTLSKEQKWDLAKNLTDLTPCSDSGDIESCLKSSVGKSDVEHRRLEESGENLYESLIKYLNNIFNRFL